MNPPITVIIVSYCTRDLLRNCLASLKRCETGTLTTIVVDNNSSDGSVAMVQNEFPETRLIVNRENVGFAKANNQAIKQSATKYVLLLNSDTIVLPGSLQIMLGFMEQHPETGGVACRLRFEDGTIQRTVRRNESGTGLAWLFWRLSGIGSLLRGDQTRQLVHRYLKFALGPTLRAYLDSYETGPSPMEVQTLSGACLLLRREAVDDVGLLDENFFMYMEDIDYCMRLRNAGWKLYHLPAAEIIHLGGQSSSGRMRKYQAEGYRSLFYFYQKHCPAWKLRVARLMVFLVFCFRWAWSFGRHLVSADSLDRKRRSDIAEVLVLCYRSGRLKQNSAATILSQNIGRRRNTGREKEKVSA